MDRTLRAHLALFTVNLIYGANYVVAKALMPQVIPPSGFVLLRVVGALVLFWSVRALRPERVAPGDLLRLAACGLFGIALNQIMFFNGLSLTSPLHASILMVASPILVLVISGVLLGERVTFMKLVGVVIGAAGALSLIFFRDAATTAGSSSIGDLYILINAASFALFLVLVKPMMAKYSAVTVMSWCFLAGALFTLPFGWVDLGRVAWSQLTDFQWAAIVFVVVLVTFVAYLLNAWALRTVNPSVVGTYIYLQPVLAVVFGWCFFALRDTIPGLGGMHAPLLSIGALFSAAAIFIGVHLVGRADARGR